MGQKVNPNIFRLNSSNHWSSKYIEKKSSELPVYSFRDLELEKFIHQFFKNNGLLVCKLNLNSTVNSIKILVSYYLTPKSIFFANNLIKTQNISLSSMSYPPQINNSYRKKYSKIKLSVMNYLNYNKINYVCQLKKIRLFKKKQSSNFKMLIKKSRKNKIFHRLRFLKHYKKYLSLTNNKNMERLKNNSFLVKLMKIIDSFYGFGTKINLIMSQLNLQTCAKLKLKSSKSLKKLSGRLRRYQRNDFFKEGLSIMFHSLAQNNSANLISQFIGNQLKLLKRHNFFLKFIKATLSLFLIKISSKIKGIKIKIKGRFNGAPRSRRRILNLGQGVAVLSHNEAISYSESTSFTPNGTFGIKVWLSKKQLADELTKKKKKVRVRLKNSKKPVKKLTKKKNDFRTKKSKIQKS